MLLVQAQAYRPQYGLNSIYLVPVNVYGPGDSFAPERSHVIPALVKKCFDAIHSKANYIDVWGTGSASREFLYVEDCVRSITLATQHYESAAPVNLGTRARNNHSSVGWLDRGAMRFPRRDPMGRKQAGWTTTPLPGRVEGRTRI
jgi:nucleoside-diphosphate-sugar epimerase